MEILKLIIFLAFIFILLLFGALNPSSISVNFFGWQSPSVSFVLIFFGAVLIGSIIAGIFGLINESKLKGIISKRDREKKELEQKMVRLELKIRELEEKIENSSS